MKRATSTVEDTKHLPVARAVRTRVVHPHDDEDVLEVRADGLGSEGVSAGLLEHHGHNVVPDVSLPQQLVVVRERTRRAPHSDHLAHKQVVRLWAARLVGRSLRPHLLLVVGRVGEQRRHVEHELVVLESGVQRVGSGGIGCRKSEFSEIAVIYRCPRGRRLRQKSQHSSVHTSENLALSDLEIKGNMEIKM